MDYMGEEYFKLKASIIKYERFILKELGFCVHVKHPHKVIIAYLQILELEKNSQLAQKAWNFMNDSLRTNVFVRFSPETIACACIFLSARQLRIALPQKPPWWTVFEVSFEDIEATAMEILALYRRPRAFYIDLEKKLSVLKEALAKKQVEIKEINLKKKTAAGTSDSLSAVNSPGDDSGVEARKEKGLSESPALTTTIHSKLQPSPLSQASLTQKASPMQVVSPPPPSSLANKASNSLLNGSKRPRVSTASFSSPTPAPPSKRRRVSHSTSPSMERSRRMGGSTKPIISPVRCVISSKVAASSGDSYSDTSLPSPVENGIPEQYRRDFSKHSTAGGSKTRSKHHHHRHRHHRSSSKPRHHAERRHHHNRHRTLDDNEEGGRGRRVGRDYQASSSSSSSGKSRRTESGRYR